MILAACARPPVLSLQLQHAAVEQGTAAARVHLPAWPSRCRQATPHADPTKATEVHGLLKLEARQLDKANADKGWCAVFYGDLGARLGKPGTAR